MLLIPYLFVGAVAAWAVAAIVRAVRDSQNRRRCEETVNFSLRTAFGSSDCGTLGGSSPTPAEIEQ